MYNFLRIMANWLPADVSASRLFPLCIDPGIIGRLYGASVLLARFSTPLRLSVRFRGKVKLPTTN